MGLVRKGMPRSKSGRHLAPRPELYDRKIHSMTGGIGMCFANVIRAILVLVVAFPAVAQTQTASVAPVDMSKHPLLTAPGMSYSPKLSLKMFDVAEKRLMTQGKNKREINEYVLKVIEPTVAAASLALDDMINPSKEETPVVYERRVTRAAVVQLPRSENSDKAAPLYSFVIPVAPAMQEPVAACVEMPVGSPNGKGEYGAYEMVYHAMIKPDGSLNDIGWSGSKRSRINEETGRMRRACADFIYAVAQKYDVCQSKGILEGCLRMKMPEPDAAASAPN